MSRIYLVDDHTLVRDGLRAMLQGGGHQVVGEAADVGTALRELPLVEPDLLLLDLVLERESGLEVLEGLAARGAAVRTVVLTMSAAAHHLAEARRLGAAGWLPKDVSRSQLLEAVEAVAGGADRFLPPEPLPPSAEQQSLAQLSARERQVVLLVVQGESSRAIGERLHLSSKTVDTYRSRLMAKLGVADLAGLVRLAVRAGLIDSGG